MKTSIAIAAAATLIAMQLPAHATSSSSASLDHFGYSLYDLNPNDSILPSIVFSANPFSGHGSSASTSVNDLAGGSQSGQDWSNAAFGAAHSTSSLGNVSADGQVSGSISSGSGALTASGSANASSAGFSADYNASAQGGDSFSGLAFTLSPYTVAVFSGTANLHATTTSGFDDVNFTSEASNASASLSVSGLGSSGSAESSQASSDSKSLFSTFDFVFDPKTGATKYTGQDQSLSAAALSASFTNNSAVDLAGSLVASVNVNGFTPVVAPVPEPGSAAMMVAGLAACGFVARRKRGPAAARGRLSS